jgi:hypothetical protein
LHFSDPLALLPSLHTVTAGLQGPRDSGLLWEWVHTHHAAPSARLAGSVPPPRPA